MRRTEDAVEVHVAVALGTTAAAPRSPAGLTDTARQDQTAVRQPSGKVPVTDTTDTAGQSIVRHALYDPSRRTWTVL